MLSKILRGLDTLGRFSTISAKNQLLLLPTFVPDPTSFLKRGLL